MFRGAVVCAGLVAVGALAGILTAAAQQPGFGLTAPVLKDRSGAALANPAVDQMTVITATITGNGTETQDFVAMLEARSSSGITELLEFQTGQVAPGGRTEIGISWTPVEQGRYELRTFLVSSMAEPQLLSGVMKQEITVE